jgi:hypothetical protein
MMMMWCNELLAVAAAAAGGRRWQRSHLTGHAQLTDSNVLDKKVEKIVEKNGTQWKQLNLLWSETLDFASH